MYFISTNSINMAIQIQLHLTQKQDKDREYYYPWLKVLSIEKEIFVILNSFVKKHLYISFSKTQKMLYSCGKSWKQPSNMTRAHVCVCMYICVHMYINIEEKNENKVIVYDIGHIIRLNFWQFSPSLLKEIQWIGLIY